VPSKHFFDDFLKNPVVFDLLNEFLFYLVSFMGVAEGTGKLIPYWMSPKTEIDF